MLKLLSSSHTRFVGPVDHLCSELSRSTLSLVPRRKYKSDMCYKNNNPNVCSLNQKSVIPELWAVSTRKCYDIQPASDEKPSLTSEQHNFETMTEPQTPEMSQSSYAGKFNVNPANINLCRSTGDEENSWRNAKRRRSACNHSPMNCRFWEAVNKPLATSNSGSFKFRMLSYNVLAQYLLEVHPYLYRKCDSQCLKWPFRSTLLLKEITTYSPDILCLQEVQVSHIPTFYKRLEEMGYTGIFKQKTGQRQDGCAIYFRHSVFKMIEYISIEFLQPDLPILNRDNVGIALKLVPVSACDSPFIVATTHLLFNPRRTDVRLAQMQLFLAEIDRFSFSAKKGKGHLPIILTGDLNSMPDSAIVSLLSDGLVRATEYRDGSDWTNIGVTDNCQHLAVYLNRQKGDTKPLSTNKLMIYNSDSPQSEIPLLNEEMCVNKDLFNTGTVGHSLQLKSVYSQIKQDGHPEATTYQNKWVTVDYMFYSRQSGLNVVERLYLPTVQECEAIRSLPNCTFGSDHLALGAVFELNTSNSKL